MIIKVKSPLLSLKTLYITLWTTFRCNYIIYIAIILNKYFQKTGTRIFTYVKATMYLEKLAPRDIIVTSKNNRVSITSYISRTACTRRCFRVLIETVPHRTQVHRPVFTNVEFPKQILSLPTRNSVGTRELLPVAHVLQDLPYVLLRFLLPVVISRNETCHSLRWRFYKTTYTCSASKTCLVMYFNRHIVSHDRHSRSMG